MDRLAGIIKAIWKPVTLGVVLGLIASIATVAGLSILTTGIAENAIGLYSALFLLAAALGGPLASTIAVFIFVSTGVLFGPPEMQALLTIPETYWSNVIALSITLGLVSLVYRGLYMWIKMPVRLLIWAVVIIAYYLILNPAAIIPQYLLLDSPTSEIWPAIRYSYENYVAQAAFDILVTSLVFVALPAAYTRPLWYEPKITPESNVQTEKSQGQIEAVQSEMNHPQVHHER